MHGVDDQISKGHKLITVSEMTYTVSSGMLNSTIHTYIHKLINSKYAISSAREEAVNIFSCCNKCICIA